MPTECAVSSQTGDGVTQSVEVSGWDADGQFFVEIADVDLSDSGDMTAHLRHRVDSGSLVFVRLWHAQDADAQQKSYPTAHEARATETPDFTGRCRTRLTTCQPRDARRLGDQKVATRI